VGGSILPEPTVGRMYVSGTKCGRKCIARNGCVRKHVVGDSVGGSI